MTDPFNALVTLIGTASQAVSSLSVQPEERLIIVAMGKEFRNGDRGLPFHIPEIFWKDGSDRASIVLGTYKGRTYTLGDQHKSIKTLSAIPLVKRKQNEYEFFSVVQGVRFVLRIVETKDQFVSALQTPGAHVLYSGHARYGRGPCFGSGGSSRGEMWEEGSGPHPNKDGIFRMGYPFIAVPVEEILEHGYTANLVEAVVRPKAADCDPDLAPHLGGLAGRTVDQLGSSLFPQLRVKDRTKKWWSYRAGRKNEMHVVLHAGWENTLSTPDDIGAITPTCKVISHLGCSTYIHNYPVVRKLKQWVKGQDDRYAYWTTDLSDWATDHYFLQKLLTYDQYNAYQPLENSLKYAVAESNKLLLKDGDACRIK
jgi:hypothetical protein